MAKGDLPLEPILFQFNDLKQKAGIPTEYSSNAETVIIIYNYFTGKGILLYQGFLRPNLPTKHSERSKGCFAGKTGRRNPWLSKIVNFLEKVVVHNFIVF